MAKFDHIVKYNGVFYKAGEDVPVKKEKPAKEDKDQNKDDGKDAGKDDSKDPAEQK